MPSGCCGHSIRSGDRVSLQVIEFDVTWYFAATSRTVCFGVECFQSWTISCFTAAGKARFLTAELISRYSVTKYELMYFSACFLWRTKFSASKSEYFKYSVLGIGNTLIDWGKIKVSPWCSRHTLYGTTLVPRSVIAPAHRLPTHALNSIISLA